jgi:hypothetical protein
MWTSRDPSISHRPKLLTSRNGPLALGECRHDHSEMAVDTDKAIVLYNHLKPARALLLDAEYRAGSSRQNWCACRCWQIDTIMIRACLRFIRQYPRAEWR